MYSILYCVPSKCDAHDVNSTEWVDLKGLHDILLPPIVKPEKFAFEKNLHASNPMW